LPILATITRNESDRDEDFGMGMNVNLTPQLEDLVRRKVASGMYTSASEVVREALRLMEEQDQLRAARLAQLRNDIHEGLDSGASEPWDAEATKRLGRARRTSPGGGGTA
jgi:antitoxin ParD1/3/4